LQAAAQREGKIARDRASKIEARLVRRITRLQRRCEGVSLVAQASACGVSASPGPKPTG
jgi:hypothetical protein